jgi:hypothetical protein
VATPEGIPNSQDEVDFTKGEEHLVFFLRNLPTYQGVGMVTHSGFLKVWAKELFLRGVFHRDYLLRLADEDGNINVSQLPQQVSEFQKSFRGPRHQYNPAARWVPKGTPAPQPMRLQDVSQLTREEQEAMAEQLRDLGVIPREPIPQHSAEVTTD